MPPGLPKPGTLRLEVLEALCRNDSASVQELRRWLRPDPPAPGIIRTGEGLRRRGEELQHHRRAASRQIRRELSALQRRGLVESEGPAELEQWAARLVAREVEKHGEEEGLRSALEGLVRYAYPSGFIDHDPYAVEPDEEGEVSPAPPARIAVTILALLADGPKRRSEVAAVALGGRPENGAFQRAWERFVDAGVVRPSSQRLPTEAGRAFVAEHAAGGAACAS